MRLSEAIRLGAMVGPQAFGDFTKETVTRPHPLKFWGVETRVISYCAIAGAHVVAGMGAPECTEDIYMPWRGPSEKCPHCNAQQDSVADVVMHLNDEHEWTRERIAEWVETVEQAQDAPPVQQQDAVTV